MEGRIEAVAHTPSFVFGGKKASCFTSCFTHAHTAVSTPHKGALRWDFNTLCWVIVQSSVVTLYVVILTPVIQILPGVVGTSGNFREME